MRRREFITALGGAAAAWPLAGRAQQPAMPVIGFVHVASPETTHEYLAAFRQGLGDIGYVEGRNVLIEYRWASDQNDRLPTLIADLVRRQVSVIAIPESTLGALSAKAATQTIPIVYMQAADSVRIGLVNSLNRPGGNVTGIDLLLAQVVGKRVELLHEFLPADTLIPYLRNPTNPIFAESEMREVQVAARALGMRVVFVNISRQSEIETALADVVQQGAGALLVGADAFFRTHIEQIVALASRDALPAIYPWRQAVPVGGLMSYGTDFLDGYRKVGVYTGRILKGEKPADLPVQQVTKMELLINLKTAKALGLTLPTALLVRADEVIE